MDKVNILEKVRKLLPDSQSHIIEHINSIAEQSAINLYQQIENIDWKSLDKLITPLDMTAVEAPNVIRLSDRNDDSFHQVGEQAYRDGKVASLIVAGGQGTRLGFEGPKGCFKLPELNSTIFEIHFANHKVACEKYETKLSLLIMTGQQNDQETKDFLKSKDYYGLDSSQIHFFTQASVPSFDEDGKLVLMSADSLLMSPNGHGGCVDALIRSGVLQQVIDQGVEFINYIQVDNILSRLDDPFAVGLAISKNLDAITKVVKKRDAMEKVGHLVKCEGKDQIVEYSSLTDEQKQATDAQGDMLMPWANTAKHIWSTEFLLSRGEDPLPYNRSAPKAATALVDGQEQETKVVKYERFIFDLLRFTDKSLGLEVSREREFAPVKNHSGQDSPETATALYKGAQS